MRKIILFFIILINLYANRTDDLLLGIKNKIIYALNCNAKISSISHLKVNDYKLVAETNKYQIYNVFGSYKSILSASFHFKGIGIGDEFHPINGSFTARVKIDKKTFSIIMDKIFYKISFKKGYVIKQCLLED